MSEQVKETGLTLSKERALNEVSAKIAALAKDTGITLPKNYSSANAINSAWLKLQEVKDNNKKPALEVCTKNSIVESLYNMVLQGLSPAKDQCYFIVYGNKLTLMKSYLGNIAATKRLKGVKNVYANIIYEGDEFAYEIDLETGIKKITKHNQNFENIDIDKIKGAYAVVVVEEGLNYVEVMNINQIRKAWNQGTMKGQSGAHKNFTDEMAKRTVINRACKYFTKTSDDSDSLIEAINQTYEYDEEDIVQATHEEVKEEIKKEANKGEIIDIPANKKEPIKEKVVAEQTKIIDVEITDDGGEPF
ncbi:recombinase RecT [Clostridium beijerinckii]|uniref:recombinase RecT n=1 Tax=Clostridium beijerinckii TaxID=1520 RepID=UPI0013611F54|nr:RecT family recombinase [Clostridium beijerinckii]MZK53323.1 recombinase RecT [Clostridium beijerinckii]MZK61428.1 recombinase RecT [Clostridium beijerinckii]MZK71670.1 recombinase RecT [Clostridium beijerinckii]MZK77063.1 recombinase RecT [Clostridium beijerinckii]MZK86718.1 recombinase RecT [Clostridium beijerinckii]